MPYRHHPSIVNFTEIQPWSIKAYRATRTTKLDASLMLHESTQQEKLARHYIAGNPLNRRQFN
jgi:hypothetical protein